MRVIFLFIICFVSLVCCGQEEFTISGTLKGFTDGNIFILKPNGNEWDTLAVARMEKGSFELRGKESGIAMADLVIAGQGEQKFMLEKGQFIVRGEKGNISIEGGEAQKLYNCFQAISSAMTRKEDLLTKEYYAAKESKDERVMKQLLDDLDQLLLEWHIKENELIKANPDAYVSAFVIYTAMNTMHFENFMLVSLKKHLNYELLREKFMLLGEQGKKTEYGRIVADYVAEQERVVIGALAPDFEITTPDGESISLYALDGKVKLIDFWASWCGPCRQENPNVVKIYNKFRGKGLEILGISLDSDKKEWTDAIRKDGLRWKHGAELKGWKSSVVQLYKVRSVPCTILLDENNRIVAKNLRGKELEKKIEELLKNE
ncbi:TlpA disulfide reductase family protein [Butyricimonas sp.]|uniref:TlpA disulfide reductase family protein n=1 Tax=Butyricimonas sp. TaxID=1969738 RepID=UPI0025BC3B30|nr:TlpA disulfide reductase family protein [Butyricimonas sp.]